MESIKQCIQNSAYFIIAEIGMNHDGSFGNALTLIEEAKNTGVDAVKFQMHISEEESLTNAPNPPYFKLEDRYEYFKRTSFSLDKWKKLRKFAQTLNLYFIVSPFSQKAVDIIEKVDIDAYKIASGETTNLPLLKYIYSKKTPVLLSTGMSNWEEIMKAVNVLKDNLIVLFQCSSQYPCLPENVGLNIIKEMVEKYKGTTIGYSDHTLDNSSSIASYIMGARVFEKHFTLSNKMYGADAKFSLEPKDMRYYVKGIKFISKALKNPVNKDHIEIYKEMKIIFEKSIVAARDLNKGHVIELNDLKFKKPGNGIRADKYKEIIGKKLIKSIEKDKKIVLDYLKK